MDLLGGRYARERVIGRGGMGSVWVGTDELLQRPVALKELAPDASHAAAREARLAATVTHPHVVPVFDLLIDEGRPWLVMEYVAGPSLAQHLTTHGAMSPDEAAVLISQLADALQASHAAGVVHRDVKPSNVLLAAPDRALLTDFGVARTQDATMTAGVLTASPAYLAPEVAAGKPATAAGDVWSLGATLFHMLEGRAPYDVVDGNVLGVLYRIVEQDPPTSERAGWLAPLLRGTMTKDPDRRWTLEQVRTFLSRPPRAAAAGATAAPAEATLRLPGVADTAERPAVAAALRTGWPSGPWRSRPVLLAAGAAAAVLVIVLIAVLASRGDGSPRGGVPTGSPSSAAGSSAPATAAAPTAAGVSAFVRQYLATAPSDPAAAFAMLTPAYQQSSGGLAGYRGFWGDVTGIQDISAITPTLQPLGVSYTYTYTLRGAGTRTEQVSLRLDYQNGTYLIAGASSQPAAAAAHGPGPAADKGHGHGNGNGHGDNKQ